MRKLLKGQIWYFDLIIALTIFTLIVILSFKYISETFMFESSDIIDEAKTFSDSVMSEGIPSSWDEESVRSFGIMTNNSIDLRKLSLFYNMTSQDYWKVKNMLSLQNDFLIFFGKDILNSTYVGYPGYNLTFVNQMDTDDRIELTRYVTYRHDNMAEIISMKIVMWNVNKR